MILHEAMSSHELMALMQRETQPRSSGKEMSALNSGAVSSVPPTSVQLSKPIYQLWLMRRVSKQYPSLAPVLARNHRITEYVIVELEVDVDLDA